MKDTTNEFLQALLVAPDARKKKALQILRGDMPVEAAPTSDALRRSGHAARGLRQGVLRPASSTPAPRRQPLHQHNRTRKIGDL